VKRPKSKKSAEIERPPAGPSAQARIDKVGSRYLGAALTGKLNELPIEIAEEWHAAHVAREHGLNRRRGTTYNWQSVIDLLIAGGKIHVLNARPIQADAVRDMLLTLDQTKDVRAAATDYYKTFIQWVRRGLDNKELQLPPPLPPAVFVHADDYLDADTDDPPSAAPFWYDDDPENM
jgi:hypothetical protein